jgi:hypothetical protein
MLMLQCSLISTPTDTFWWVDLCFADLKLAKQAQPIYLSAEQSE